MNAVLARVNDRIEAPAFDLARRTAGERLILGLTALGMIASLVAFVSYHGARSQMTEGLVATAVVRSQTYYAAHAAEIVLLISAGLLALFSTDWRTIAPGYLTRFMLLIGAALLMTVRGYSFSDLVSTKLADATGPFPFFTSLLIFVGARRRNWDLVDKAIATLGIIFSVMSLLGVAALSAFSREEAVAKLAGPLNALFWPASWIALRDYPAGSVARRFCFVPIAIYSFGSFFTLTRLNFVMIFAFLVVYSYVQHRRKAPQGATWVVGLMLAVWLSLFAAVFLRNTRAFESVETVAEAFLGRIDEDTRTGQLESFAESVSPGELLLGRGSLATWYWQNEDYKGGTDVGYLTLLLYGGLPLLITYIGVHLTPCLGVFRRNPSSFQLACAAIVLLWSIRMFSSSYPGEAPDYYPVLFCVGACISREPLSVKA